MNMYEMHTKLVEEKACIKWILDISDPSNLFKSVKSEEFKLLDINKSCFFVYSRNPNGGFYYEVYLQLCDEFKNSVSKAFIVTSEKKFELFAGSSWTEKSYASLTQCLYNFFNESKGVGNIKEFWLEITYLKKDSIEISFPHKIIPNSYAKFFKNQELCDIVFSINEKKIKAHAVILAAASPYFSAMFNNKDTLESQNREVDLSKDNDVTQENFQGFLEYIYGCKSIDKLSNIVDDLLVLADKYNVDQLHEACQIYMSNNITKENITKILLMSDKYNCEALKTKAVRFAKMNIAIIKSSADFDALCKTTDLMRLML